jgi:hypothetical protein
MVTGTSCPSVKAAAKAVPAASFPVTRGLVSWWKLDESAGVTATDSQDSNNGTNTGATVNQTSTMSFTGTCYLFASDDIVTVANNANINFSDEFSYSFWFVCTGATASHHYKIFSKRNGGSGSDFECSIFNSKIDWIAKDVETWIFPSQVDMSLNLWNHMVVTYDSGDAMRLYLNGNLVGTQTTNLNSHTIGNLSNGGTSLYIGGNYEASADFDGRIDEVAIFNVELTSTEVNTIYAARY